MTSIAATFGPCNACRSAPENPVLPALALYKEQAALDHLRQKTWCLGGDVIPPTSRALPDNYAGGPPPLRNGTSFK